MMDIIARNAPAILTIHALAALVASALTESATLALAALIFASTAAIITEIRKS